MKRSAVRALNRDAKLAGFRSHADLTEAIARGAAYCTSPDCEDCQLAPGNVSALNLAMGEALWADAVAGVL